MLSGVHEPPNWFLLRRTNRHSSTRPLYRPKLACRRTRRHVVGTHMRKHTYAPVPSVLHASATARRTNHLRLSRVRAHARASTQRHTRRGTRDTCAPQRARAHAHHVEHRRARTHARLHARTHARTRRSDAQCDGARIPYGGRARRILSQRAECLHEQQARRLREEDKLTATHNSPPHTFKPLRVHGSRALRPIRAALVHVHAQPLHSRRQRPQTERNATERNARSSM